MMNDLPRFEVLSLDEAEGGGYLIEFPRFPGCIADGETHRDAMLEGADALKSHLEPPAPARMTYSLPRRGFQNGQ